MNGNTFLVCTSVFFLSMLALPPIAHAQSPLPTGSVTVDVSTPTCPTSEGWLSGVICKHAFVSCPVSNGSASLGITCSADGMGFGLGKRV